MGLVALVALFLITSCNKEKELAKYISSDKVELTGDRTDLFEIDADSVKVMLIPIGAEGKKWEVRTIVPIRNTTPWSQIPEGDQSRSSFICGVLMYIDYLDGYGSTLDMSIESYYPNVEKVLKSDDLITEDMAIAEMSLGDKSYKKQKAYFDKIEGIKIKVSLSWAHVGNAYVSSSKSATSSSKSYNNKSVDELLNAYEKCIEDYISFRKKAKNGDLSAINKYMDLSDDAEEIEDAIDKYENSMSDAQFDRYLELIDKLTKAMTSL